MYICVYIYIYIYIRTHTDEHIAEAMFGLPAPGGEQLE